MKPSKGREGIYQQVLDLHEINHWGARKIARTLPVPLRTVSHWIANSPIKSRYGNDTPRIIPKLEPSSELAYLLGATLGDGTVGCSNTSGAWIITLRATDLEFTEEYTRCLTHILGREYSIVKKIWKDNPRWKPYWRVDARSRLFGKYLKQPLQAFKPLLQAYPRDYLRGFFDAEGSAYQRQWDGRPYWGVRICNTRKDLIDLADHLLRGLGIVGHIYGYPRKEPRRKPQHIWLCQKRDYLYRFRELVNFTIPRKSAILATLP